MTGAGGGKTQLPPLERFSSSLITELRAVRGETVGELVDQGRSSRCGGGGGGGGGGGRGGAPSMGGGGGGGVSDKENRSFSA